MRSYTAIQGLDKARYEALINAPLPNPLPANAVLVVGADWCPDTQHSVMDSGYATQTRDGRPIFYLNDANPAAHQTLRGIPGKELLGGGIDSETPPSRPERQYNYPTVAALRDGAIQRVLYADTVPANGLLDPSALEQRWQAISAERQQRAALPAYEPERAAPLFANPLPATLQPNHVYAVVSSNCGHCHELLSRSGYPQRTEDGRPITYLNLAVGPDGSTAINPAATALYDNALANLNVPGFPSFITTDANARPSLQSSGPDAILGQFFPHQLQTETARGSAPAPAPAPLAEDVAAAPPPPVPAAAPPRSVSSEGLQRELLTIGTAITRGRTDPAIVAAVETFYRNVHPNHSAMDGLGTLTDREITAVLNRMQAAAFTPGQHDELRALGTALGVPLASLQPASASAMPAAPATPAAGTPDAGINGRG